MSGPKPFSSYMRGDGTVAILTYQRDEFGEERVCENVMPRESAMEILSDLQTTLGEADAPNSSIEQSTAPVSQRVLTDEKAAHCAMLNYGVPKGGWSDPLDPLDPPVVFALGMRYARDNGYLGHPSQELIRAGDAMYDAMRRYEMDVDEDPPMKHREMMDAWDAAKQSSPSQPSAPKGE